ncbi:MAG TPA: LysR family transcriptional regulator [Kofleriaceae bacterium]
MVRLADVDLNLLLALDALLRERSVTHAGAALGLSQPAMSHALARLRELFGDELLVRRNNDMEPTALAESLVAPLADVLGRVEALLWRDRGFDPATAGRELVIAMTDFVEATLMPVALPRLRAGAGLRVRLRRLGAELPDRALADGDIDLAVGTILSPPAAMRVTTLYRETFAVIVRRGHPCLAAPLTPAAYAALAHVLIAAPGDGPGLVDLALEEHGLRRNVALRTPHFLTVAPLVAASDLICTVPSRIARAVSDGRGIVVLDPPLPVHGFDVQMFWHPRRERDPAVQWLRERLRAAAATLADPSR